MSFTKIAEMTCKTCGRRFKSALPHKIGIKPEIAGIDMVEITIEELQTSVKKTVYDSNGAKVGSMSLKDFNFMITDPNCRSSNKYMIKDCTFV